MLSIMLLEKQGMIEARISQIEGSLSNSQVIDVTKMDNTGKVIFGVTVKLVDLDTDQEITYQIVGDDIRYKIRKNIGEYSYCQRFNR